MISADPVDGKGERVREDIAAGLLFGCFGGWKTASFLVGSESNEDFQGFGAWKRASFLMGSEGDVRQWGPLPAGPRRPCGPCCLGVAEAPLLRKLVRPGAPLSGPWRRRRPWRLEDS